MRVPEFTTLSWTKHPYHRPALLANQDTTQSTAKTTQSIVSSSQ
ncbi:MAG TPA: hypothetical protein VJN70_13965 [Gemmatimonadaceae bacterium]|nr:hypothetical protein [Gemmatimonadaceae bacterium]